MDNKISLLESTDDQFDLIYKDEFKRFSTVHWTPIEVALLAIKWLELNEDSKVLDIGSGIGKFCTIGVLATEAHFTGVELRESLVNEAIRVKDKLGLKDVEFLNNDIKSIDFKDYKGFYYYNPFCEYLSIEENIDDSITFSQENFRQYEDYVIDQFANLSKGTKVVTYFAPHFAFPSSYELKDMFFDGTLALWEKVF